MVRVPLDLVLAMTTVVVPEATDAGIMGYVEVSIAVVMLTLVLVATTVDPSEFDVVFSVSTVTGPG